MALLWVLLWTWVRPISTHAAVPVIQRTVEFGTHLERTIHLEEATCPMHPGSCVYTW